MLNKLLIAAIILTVTSVEQVQQPGPSMPADPNVVVVVPGEPGEQVTEEFHQTYPLSATGRVNLGNINGGVKIKVWDRAAVQVDAIKKAYRRERLAEAKIEVTSTEENIRIKTEYPEEN